MTPGRLLNFASRASAGGHDEQPWLVNNSTTAAGAVPDGPVTAGLDPASKPAASTAKVTAYVGRRLMASSMQEEGRNIRLKSVTSGQNSVTTCSGSLF